MTSVLRTGTAALAAVLALAGACGKEAASVQLNVRVTGDERRNPFRNPGSATARGADVDVFTLEVFNPASGASVKKEVTNDFTVSDSIKVGALEVGVGTGWYVQLSGADRDGRLWAMGRSGAFEVPEKGSTQATVVLGIADDFASSSKLASGLGPYASASPLPDGRVMILGLGGAWLHDPTTGKTCSDCLTGAVPAARWLHAAVKTAGGKYLLAGGLDEKGEFQRDAFLFDPVAVSFSKLEIAKLPARAGMAVAALPNGSVLLAGGRAPAGESGTKAFLLDPEAATVTEGPALASAVFLATATPLADGTVLVAGGLDATGAPVAAAAIYTADGTSSTKASPMNVARGAHSATLLGDGYVLVFGGRGAGGESLAKPEVYSTQAGKFLDVAGADGLSPKAGHAAVVLDDGAVLLVGGDAEEAGALDPGRLVPGVRFTPVGEVSGSYIGLFEDVGRVLARSGAALAVLPDASVLVAGGGRPPLGTDPAVAPAPADWTTSLELYVPCATKGRACPK